MDAVDRWEASGSRERLAGHEIFVIDRRGEREDAEPLLVLHGFPTCSFDWRHVLGTLGRARRVVLLDLLGHGLSAKPDQPYSLFEHADIVQACVNALGIEAVALLTHDIGDSVGGEILARALEGTLGFEVTRRVLTNGTIYMDLVQLSAGQQLLLSLPDEMLPEDSAPNEDLFRASLAFTFGPGTQPSEDELAAQWKMVAREGGNRMLPRIIRYVEERRVREGRWTGAIEKHPSPLTILWGDADPIAVFAMAERLHEARPDAPVHRLEGVGHYPMIEAPERFADIAGAALA